MRQCETVVEGAHACERRVRSLRTGAKGRQFARGADGTDGFERQLRGDRGAATQLPTCSD